MDLGEKYILFLCQRNITIKWLLITFYYTHRSLQKLLPGWDGNKYKDPWLDGVQRMRAIETLTHKWDISIKSLLCSLRESCTSGSRKIVRTRGHGGLQENSLPKTTGFTCIWHQRDCDSIHWDLSMLVVMGIQEASNTICYCHHSWLPPKSCKSLLLNTLCNS